MTQKLEADGNEVPNFSASVFPDLLMRPDQDGFDGNFDKLRRDMVEVIFKDIKDLEDLPSETSYRRLPIVSLIKFIDQFNPVYFKRALMNSLYILRAIKAQNSDVCVNYQMSNVNNIARLHLSSFFPDSNDPALFSYFDFYLHRWSRDGDVHLDMRKGPSDFESMIQDEFNSVTLWKTGRVAVMGLLTAAVKNTAIQEASSEEV